jgi:hypothetical protein
MAAESSSDSDALSGRGAAIGYLIGFAVAMCAITAVGTIGGLGFGPSVGLGAFVGLWGGGGFGFMLGGTLPLAREMDRAEAAERSDFHHPLEEPAGTLSG